MTTGDSPRVTYVLSAFKRAKFVDGGRHLLLKADQDPAVALVALGEAAHAVTEGLYEYEVRDEAYVSLDGPVPTPQGPMTRVAECEPAKALPLMLDRLAAELADRGITGQLVPAKTGGDQYFGNQSLPALGMLLSPLNDTDAMFAAFDAWRAVPNRGVWVEEDRHQRVVSSLTSWVTEVEGTIRVHSTGTVEVDGTDLGSYVCRALRAESSLGISATSRDDKRRRQMSFGDSEIILCDFDLDHPRQDQLASLTGLATRLAPDLAYALIRELETSTSSLRKCGHTPPKVALFDDIAYTTMVKHLEHYYVFDAGVAQVLTGSQLGKTSLNADRWTVQDLGNDRHLVTHNDPAAWLHPNPQYVHKDRRTLPPDWSDAETLATARADFGPAIMTIDTLRQHPPPLTAEQIRADPDLRNLGVTPH